MRWRRRLKMDDDADPALVAAARAGSQAAFSRLVDRHQAAVRAFLRRVARDREAADDLAQETFITGWRRLDRWRGEASFRTWLCAIAWKKARDAERSLFRRLLRDRAYADRAALERGEAPGAEDRLALADALAGLPAEPRAAVALCLSGDFSHAEAAEILGLPVGTVKSHVARGRARLVGVLGGSDG